MTVTVTIAGIASQHSVLAPESRRLDLRLELDPYEQSWQPTQSLDFVGGWIVCIYTHPAIA